MYIYIYIYIYIYSISNRSISIILHRIMVEFAKLRVLRALAPTRLTYH